MSLIRNRSIWLNSILKSDGFSHRTFVYNLFTNYLQFLHAKNNLSPFLFHILISSKQQKISTNAFQIKLFHNKCQVKEALPGILPFYWHLLFFFLSVVRLSYSWTNLGLNSTTVSSKLSFHQIPSSCMSSSRYICGIFSLHSLQYIRNLF